MVRLLIPPALVPILKQTFQPPRASDSATPFVSNSNPNQNHSLAIVPNPNPLALDTEMYCPSLNLP
jgi:hypothetical protein